MRQFDTAHGVECVIALQGGQRAGDYCLAIVRANIAQRGLDRAGV